MSASVTLPTGVTGTGCAVTITLATPPTLLTLAFSGGYPGAQTSLKSGDSYTLIGTTDKTATSIQVSDFGAGTSQTLTFTPGTSFSVSMVVADRGTTDQLLAARACAGNAAGAYGATRDTNTGGGSTEGVNLIKLNNLHPTVTFGTITYPATQSALKSSETATCAVTLANLDTVAFDSPNSQLSITDPTVIEATKTVTRIAGSYNVATNNLRCIATRAANAATTTAQEVVKIANVAAVITVSVPAARLRSGGNDGTSVQGHAVTITSDQELGAAPSMTAPAGTWTGSWTGGASVWTRTLNVADSDTKGSYNFSSLSATNRAGISTTSITSGAAYVLGGFVARDLAFAAFAQTTALNVACVTYAKLTAATFTATNQPATRMTSQGDHTNTANAFTVDALSTNPTTIYWDDASAAASNSGGTAKILQVEETV
jgi:hypothetical protein